MTNADVASFLNQIDFEWVIDTSSSLITTSINSTTQLEFIYLFIYF